MNTRLTVILAVLFILAIACSSTPTIIPTNVQEAPEVPPTSVLLSATTISFETSLPTLTNTPLTTNTLRPTITSRPTNTPEPTQAPVTLSGSGDDVVDNPWVGAGLLHITYTSGGNFAIVNYDANNEYLNLLVNTIGSYEGTVPLDFMDEEETKRFQITASGPWEIEILPLGMVRYEPIPGTFTGTGDDVILIKGGTPDLMKVDANGESNFAIWIYGDSGDVDLAVNEIAPYSGTVMLPNDALVLVVTADGKWSIEIETR